MNPNRPMLRSIPSFGEFVALLWIIATFLYYYVNFSIVFYRTNQSAIEQLLEKLGFLS